MNIVNDIELESAYSKLPAEQQTMFLPFGIPQAEKIIASYTYLLGHTPYEKLFELYITIASRIIIADLANDRIATTVKLRFGDIIVSDKLNIIIDCSRRLVSNFSFNSQKSLSNSIATIKEFDEMFSEEFSENKPFEDYALLYPNFGYSIDNPILAHSPFGSYEYLNLLYTVDAIPLTWERVGTGYSDLSPSPIDMYNLFLPTGKVYSAVYINMYVSEVSTSLFCPKGLQGRGLDAVSPNHANNDVSTHENSTKTTSKYTLTPNEFQQKIDSFLSSIELLEKSTTKPALEEVDKLLTVTAGICDNLKTDTNSLELENQLCVILHGLSISLYNSFKDIDISLYIINRASIIFAKLPDAVKMLADDKSALIAFNRENDIAFSQPASIPNENKSENTYVPQNKKRLTYSIIGIIAFIVLAVLFGNRLDANSDLPPAQELPRNGYVFYCKSTSTPSEFTVTNNDSLNYYMKFVGKNSGKTVVSFFVRAHSSVHIPMPAGTYELRYAYGSTWYGEEYLFGSNTQYAKDEDLYNFSDYTWSISLYTTTHQGETMDVAKIAANDF